MGTENTYLVTNSWCFLLTDRFLVAIILRKETFQGKKTLKKKYTLHTLHKEKKHFKESTTICTLEPP